MKTPQTWAGSPLCSFPAFSETRWTQDDWPIVLISSRQSERGSGQNLSPTRPQALTPRAWDPPPSSPAGLAVEGLGEPHINASQLFSPQDPCYSPNGVLTEQTTSAASCVFHMWSGMGGHSDARPGSRKTSLIPPSGAWGPQHTFVSNCWTLATPTTHVVFKAHNAESPTETSCPAISASSRKSPPSLAGGAGQCSSGQPPLPALIYARVCPQNKELSKWALSCITRAGQHSAWKYVVRREGWEDEGRNLSFSKSPALWGRTGSCLHTRGGSVSSWGSCDRPLLSSDPWQCAAQGNAVEGMSEQVSIIGTHVGTHRSGCRKTQFAESTCNPLPRSDFHLGPRSARQKDRGSRLGFGEQSRRGGCKLPRRAPSAPRVTQT